MDTNQTQPISDDQELAKVLQGVQKQARDIATHDPEDHHDNSMQYEEMPAPGAKQDAPAVDLPAVSSVPATTDNTTSDPTTATASTTADRNDPALDEIKKEALEELRPLVAKLDLPPKEKFDTMLLIIRSTDDRALLGPAHEAAKTIEDETDRAEALLDVIKEIDYFASQKAAV